MRMSKFEIKCFRKKFKPTPTSDLYQEITKFLTYPSAYFKLEIYTLNRAKYAEGLIYIGCFANDNQGLNQTPTFNFVYLQPVNLS